MATSVFKIYLTRVASLDTRQGSKPQLVWKVAGRGSVPPQRLTDSTPVFAEMAIPGTVFSGRWDERKFLENPELSRYLGWRSSPDPKMLVEAANQYAAAQLDLQAKYAESIQLQTLRDAVERLRRELDSARNTPLSCLACLGWGSGFVSKTAFLDGDQESFRKVLRTVPSISKSIREGVPFPKTRRVVFVGGKPATLPGWVRVEFQYAETSI